MAWADAVRQLSVRFRVQWNGSSWTDESARLLGVNGNQSLPPFWKIYGGNETQQPWTLTVTLQSDDDYYSPFNSSSPIYSYISATRGYGLTCDFAVYNADDGWVTVFTGVIDRMTIDSTTNNRCTITALDNWQKLLQLKHSTIVYTDQTAPEWVNVLATAGGVGGTPDLDPGLYVIPYCWTDDENIASEMAKVAHSEGGLLFFGTDGELYYRNLEAWIRDSEYSSSQYTFTTSRFADLSIPFDISSVYNKVTVIASPRTLMAAEEIGRLSEALTVIPGETKTITIRHKYPSVGTMSVSATIVDFAANDISDDITITPTSYGQQTELEIENTGSAAAVLTNVVLTGTPLYGAPDLERSLTASDADIGASPIKALSVGNNEYIQTPGQCEFLTPVLRDRLKKGRTPFGITEQPMIPTLWPGYRVTVQESDSGVNNTAFIQNIRWNYKSGALTADYECIEATEWFPYSNYHELGTDQISDNHRAFY